MLDDVTVHNKKVESTAQFFNNLSVTFLATGFLTPSGALLVDYCKSSLKPYNHQGMFLLSAFGLFCIIIAIICRIKCLNTYNLMRRKI